MKKRLIGLLLCLTMILGMVPVTALAAGLPDEGTLVLSGGKVYENTVSAGNLLTDVPITGAAGARGYTYTFGYLNFSTSAPTALKVLDQEATLALTRDVIIRGGDGETGNCYGIEAKKLTVTGGNLEIRAGSAARGTSYGIYAASGLTVESSAVKALATGMPKGYGIFCETGGLTLTDSELNAEGETLAVNVSPVTAENGMNAMECLTAPWTGFYDGLIAVESRFDWRGDGTDDLTEGRSLNLYRREGAWTVTFDPNGGSGTMTGQCSLSGEHWLPEYTTFVPPAGKRFKGWAVSPKGTALTDRIIQVEEDRIFYALWEPIPETDFTLVLSGGAFYKDHDLTDSDNGILLSRSELNTYRLSGDAGSCTYTFDGIAFKTKALTALVVQDASATILLTSGTVNSLRSGDTEAEADVCGIRAMGDLRITGSGSLTAAAGAAPNGNNYGIHCAYGDLRFPSGRITVTCGDASDSWGIWKQYGNVYVTGGTLEVSASPEGNVSLGVLTNELNVTGGEIRGAGGDAVMSVGICASSVAVTGGTVTAEGGSGEGLSIGMDCEKAVFTGGSIALKGAFWAVTTTPTTLGVNGKNVMEVTAADRYDGRDTAAISDWRGDGTEDVTLYKYMTFVQTLFPLKAPELTAFSDTGSGDLILKWNKISGAVKYRLYRAESYEGPYTFLKTTVSASSYTDTSVPLGQTRYYKVRALAENKDEDSLWSNIVMGTRHMAQPEMTLTVKTSTGKPVVKWQAVENAGSYEVYRSDGGMFSRVHTASAAGSYTDTKAKAGKYYDYYVRAIHKTDEDIFSDSRVAGRMCDLSRPRISLTVKTATGKPVVKWETVEGAAKYRVYRATKKDGTYKLIYTAVSARSYTDTTAEAGVNYYYKIRAVHKKSSADSAYSEILNRVCDLAKPEVSIALTSGGSPKLTWKAIPGAEKYYVYRSSSKDGTYEKVKTTVSATSFTDKDAKAGKTWYYKVKAIHEVSSAASAYSTVKSIKAK